MNPETDSDDSDIPLDDLLQKEKEAEGFYIQWALKKAEQALGENHNAEMEKNHGIARNRHRQREEEYNVILNKRNEKGGQIVEKPKTYNHQKRRIITKHENESSEDDIYVSCSEAKHNFSRKIRPKRSRSNSDNTLISKKENNAVLNSSTPANHHRSIKDIIVESDGSLIYLPAEETSTIKSDFSKKSEKSKNKNQLEKNRFRTKTVLKEIEELEKQRNEIDGKIKHRKEMLNALELYNTKLCEDPLNVGAASITISSDDDNANEPIWQQKWHKNISKAL